MKFLFRWAFRLFVLGVILVVALLLIKDTLVRSLAERRIHSQTGLEVRIGKFETGLLTPTVTIENFKLYNSAEFGGAVFLDLPEIHMEYDPAGLAIGQLHFKLVRFNLAEVNVVENKAGVNNLEAIKQDLEKKAGIQGPDKEKRKTPQIEFTGIDTLNLTIGRVSYTSLKHPKQDRAFDIGFKNRILKNVKSEADLSGLLVELMIKYGMNFLNPGMTLPEGAPEGQSTPQKDERKPREKLPSSPKTSPAK